MNAILGKESGGERNDRGAVCGQWQASVKSQGAIEECDRQSTTLRPFGVKLLKATSTQTTRRRNAID